MVRLPRDVHPQTRQQLLLKHGFVEVRQTGSHLSMVHAGPPPCRVVIPKPGVIKIGTLHAILSTVATHLKIEESELAKSI